MIQHAYMQDAHRNTTIPITPRTYYITQHHAASRSITQHHAASRSITQHHAASRSITQHHAALYHYYIALTTCILTISIVIMHYSLQEQPTPQKFSTLVDFMEFLKRTSSLKKVDSLPLDECSLCSNNQLDVIKVSTPFYPSIKFS